MFQDSLTKKIAEAAAQIKTEPEIIKTNEKSVEGAVEKIMDEELKGNQHKIDANKNNKVDAHDFKLLRAQKEKEKANSMKFGKNVKEETEEIDEASKEEEGKFHNKLDKLVHKTFGKSSDEKKMKEEVELDEALWPGTPEYEKKFPKASKPGERRQTQDYGYQGKEEEHGETTFKKEVKPTKRAKYGARQNFVRSRKISGKQLKDDVQFGFTDILEAYNTHGLKLIAAMMKEEPDNEEFTKEVADQKAKMDGKKKGGDVAKASVQAVKQEETEIQVINADIANGVEMIDIEERSLTEPETAKKEEIVKSMKKGMQGFKQRYGERAKEVIYATATARAKENA
jgi:hypothetical protein